MNKTFWNRFLDSCSDNRKSKIENLKWLGLSVIAFVFMVTGAVAQAQQPTKIPRIGFLGTASSSSDSPRLDAFRQGLRELGYVEGKNILLEYRHAEGKPDRLPDLAAELVRLKTDVIVVAGTAAIRAAQQATGTTPIVMAVSGDAVRIGLVTSLARPGRNITGLTSLTVELNGKRLELLKELVPQLSRVVVLSNPTNPTHGPALNDMKVAAVSLGLQLQPLEVKGPDEFESAFSTISRMQAQALFALPDQMFNIRRGQVAALAVKSRLPTSFASSEWVEAGGLMSYGPNFADLYRRAATYVDKILKGAKPGDLPVEQPMKFELIINLETAKQIGLTIPPNVLARADRVIK